MLVDMNEMNILIFCSETVGQIWFHVNRLLQSYCTMVEQSIKIHSGEHHY